MNTIEYKIDSENNIIFVNKEWDHFALNNFGEEFVSEKVIGRNLFDYISGITVRQIYLDLLNKVKKQVKSP